MSFNLNKCYRIGCIGVFLFASAPAVADGWPVGDVVVIPDGANVNLDSDAGALACFTNNGNVVFSPAALMTLTGSSHSVVASGVGSTGTLHLQGGRLVTAGSGYLIVGHLGGHGSMTIENGAEVIAQSGWFCLARNDDGQRDKLPFGELTLNGSLVVSNRVELTGYFPTGVAHNEFISARVVLNSGGVLLAGEFAKQDTGASELLFNGGTLRANRDNNSFFSGSGSLDMIIMDDAEAIFDTNGKSVKILAQSAPNDTVLKLRGESGASAVGNGTFVKVGAGTLTLRLPPECNTFTGAVTVLAGTLDLGRPLATNQHVTVHANANFVPYNYDDLSKIIWLGSGSEKMVYVVAQDTDNLDLTAINALYYDDRLAGPMTGEPLITLNNPVVHSAGSSAAMPFDLIGQGGTLLLKGTTLDSSYLRLTGEGTFTFDGSRHYNYTDAGKINLQGGGYKQNDTFVLSGPSTQTPAVLTLGSGRFLTGSSFDIGNSGYGELNINGTTISATQMRIGSGYGYAGKLTLSGGIVTVNNESYIGADGATGTLLINDGSFIVNNNLRVASNPADNRSLRPMAEVTVSNGLLRCNNFYMNSWWPSDGIARTHESGVLNLMSNGVAEVNCIYKNDDPIAKVNFKGGILRARGNIGNFLNAGQSGGTLLVTVDAGQMITLDTQGYEVNSPNPNGNLYLTGAGGLRKLGSGRLSLAADRVNYMGDTVVEAGTLRLHGNDQIPHGSGTGNLHIATHAILDLNGKNDVVNRLIGNGLAINTNGPAIFGVLADNSSDVWSTAKIGGNITLEKLGTGTMTLGAPLSASSNMIVSAGTVKLAQPVGFRFYRFKVDGVKNPAENNSMQLAEVALFNGATNVTANRVGINYDSTGDFGSNANTNACPVNEMPEKAVDGKLDTKWLDFRLGKDRSQEDKQRVWLRIDFAEQQPITHYNWATANDHTNRDPGSWRLQGSSDGIYFVDIDVQTEVAVTDSRQQWVQAEPYALDSSTLFNIIHDAGEVTVKSGATFDLNGIPERIGSLHGGGTLALGGADLTIAPGAEHQAMFFGAICGEGSIIKDGAGVQYLCGTNTYTGRTVVRAGTLSVEDIQVDHWFRFTVKKNRNNNNITQFSELALYSADGIRRNLGLMQGSNVASLLPGQFATPATYPVGNNEGADKLFDNTPGTKWCLTQNTPNPDNASTWRVVVMRLVADTPEITAYNLCTANDDSVRDPVMWELESSSDGIDWKVVDARSDIVPPSTGGTGTGVNANTGRFLYYNSSVPYLLNWHAAVSGDISSQSDAIPQGSIVEVRSGATLDLVAHEALDALCVDMLDAGTITRLIAAPNGVLYVENVVGAAKGAVLPLSVGVVENLSVLRTWKVYVNGELESGLSISVNSAGRLFLNSTGLYFILK